LSVVGPASPTPLSASVNGAATSNESSAAANAARTRAGRVGIFTPGNLAQEAGAAVPCAP
jgi:transcription elongation factor